MTDDYLTRILRANALGAFARGSVSLVTVAHQEGCTRPTGGHCTCLPDITTTADGVHRDVDAEGNPTVPRYPQ